MRILHVVTPWFPVPPERYGGIQRSLYYLLTGYNYPNDNVFLFSVGSSNPPEGVELGYIFDDGLSGRGFDRGAEILHVVSALSYARKINADIVHFHGLERCLPLLRDDDPFKYVWTVQCVPSSITDYVCRELPKNLDICFQTWHHRHLFPTNLQNVHVVPNCLNLVDFPLYLDEDRKDYLSFVGALSSNKGVLAAIEIAQRVDMPLIIGGHIKDRQYYQDQIFPLLDDSNIKYVGEVNDAQRNEIIGRSRYCLFPINWEEPFGLVLIEAGAVGTPVLALDRGSVSEVLVHGKSGFIAQNSDEIVKYITQGVKLSPFECRSVVEKNYNPTLIASMYRSIYEKAKLS